MLWFQGIRKTGTALRRHSFALCLDAALAELFRVYERLGGPGSAAGQAMNGWIEGVAADAEAGQGGQSRLAQLLRVRDLHEFVTRQPEFETLKLEVLEQLLFHRSPETRWAAVRSKLCEALPQLCGCPAPSLIANLELYKRALSDPASPAGQMLVLTALFNFDADPEVPPENWTLRFHRGRFPDHDWELASGCGRSQRWRPANPLCRWEYLAADLIEGLVRASAADAMPGTIGPPLTPVTRDAGHLNGRRDAPAITLHCRFERLPGGQAAAAQMSLLPVDPTSFVPEMQRMVHRRLGGEGVRLLALVLGHMARLRPGQSARLDLATLCAPAGETAARQLRERCRRLFHVLELLCGVELQRVETGPDGTAVRTSCFLTVLGREQACAPGHGSPPDQSDPADLRLDVAVDPIFWKPGGTLGDAYRYLPPAVLACPAREHPLLVGLAAWLPGAWERTWPQTQGVVQRSMERIFEEAGLWLRDADRYRVAEQLKRDLVRLQELGVLGQWRLVRGAGRTVLDHEYRLSAPQRIRQRANSQFQIPAEDATPGAWQAWGWA